MVTTVVTIKQKIVYIWKCVGVCLHSKQRCPGPGRILAVRQFLLFLAAHSPQFVCVYRAEQGRDPTYVCSVCDGDTDMAFIDTMDTSGTLLQSCFFEWCLDGLLSCSCESVSDSDSNWTKSLTDSKLQVIHFPSEALFSPSDINTRWDYYVHKSQCLFLFFPILW